MNESMKPGLASLVTLWALVAAPNLCRAGLLVACCHEAGEARPTVTDDCCAPQGSPALPVDRECDSCVGVCDTVAKPPDGADDAQPVVTMAVDIGAATTPYNAAFARASRGRAPQPRIPFPPSDVPLRI
jgi:hypothetical protein